MEPYSLNTLLMVFGGGIIGVALGGLWAVIICALIGLLGIAIIMAGGTEFVLMQVAFGPIFGPHVGGFGAGLAAAAYAVARKNHPSGAAKDILTPLLHTSWDVMVFGGLFSVASHLLLQVVAATPILNQTDGIAFVLITMTLLVRLVWLKEMPWGNAASIKEHGLMNTKGYSISWAGWQSPWGLNIPMNFGAAIFSASIAYGLKTQLDPMAAAGQISGTAAFVAPLLIGWCLAIFILTALQLGTGKLQQVPIVHCPSIIGAWVFLYTGSILAAGIAGIFAGIVQEYSARVFYNHGSSHIDPPALSIGICTFLVNIIMKPEFLNMAALFQ
ncbi:hypothetical protein [Desulfuromonas sp. CSMB_57]|uniref:hypothetical protein n=1 Tax=Desulfuromonas sp. CSMB_57 TaxID=2807629 RepID=UPI001CD501A2|nr:hypothetical protein [Desulfuromonas sp. CSMB_57]